MEHNKIVIDKGSYLHVQYKDANGIINVRKEEKGKKQHPGLGDILERELTRMGITQDRYKEIKEKFGFPPTCGCEKRKQWLNKVGRYLGVGR